MPDKVREDIFVKCVKVDIILGFMRKDPPEISIEWLDVNIEIKVKRK